PPVMLGLTLCAGLAFSGSRGGLLAAVAAVSAQGFLAARVRKRWWLAPLGALAGLGGGAGGARGGARGARPAPHHFGHGREPGRPVAGVRGGIGAVAALPSHRLRPRHLPRRL